MHTENVIDMNAPVEVVYALAADIPAWPRILPHYRYVRPLPGYGEDAQSRAVAMSASRSGIPVRWSAIQKLHPAAHRVVYHHIGGLTRGMDVVWEIEERDGRCHVSILHDLAGAWWFHVPLGRFIASRLFIGHIADRTLREIKRHAEAATHAEMRV